MELYKELYDRKPNYGRTSIKLLDQVLELILKVRPCAVLDYGCGKSELMLKINDITKIKCFRYDPVIEGCEILPNEKIEFVVCTDVLQHVPLYDLDNVINDITSFTYNCFFHIKCTDHPTLFANGEPTNCTVRDKEWWKKYFESFFKFVNYIPVLDDTTVSFFVTNNIEYIKK